MESMGQGAENTHKQLVLASQSPRRAELLALLGVRFSVRVADIDESRLPGESPEEMTIRLAREKAQAVCSMLNEEGEAAARRWALGGDTTVALGDEVFGKPKDRDEAIATLSRLSGRSHRVISSVCLSDGETRFEESVVSEVIFGKLTQAEIQAYCDTEVPGDMPWDKAGSYGIQGRAAAFVERINGDYSAIVGLPVRATARVFKQAGLMK